VTLSAFETIVACDIDTDGTEREKESRRMAIVARICVLSTVTDSDGDGIDDNDDDDVDDNDDEYGSDNDDDNDGDKKL
jgi:hypothetical protein